MRSDQLKKDIKHSFDLCSIKRPHASKISHKNPISPPVLLALLLSKYQTICDKKWGLNFERIAKMHNSSQYGFLLCTTQQLGKFVTSFDKSRRRSRVENVAWILREIRAQFWACCIQGTMGPMPFQIRILSFLPIRVCAYGDIFWFFYLCKDWRSTKYLVKLQGYKNSQYILGHYALSACCLLCWTVLWGICTINLISTQTSQGGIEFTKAKE